MSDSFAQSKSDFNVSNLDNLGDPISTSNKLNKMMSTLVFDDSKARRLVNWTPSKVLDKLPLVL